MSKPFRLSYKIQPCEKFPQGYSDTYECDYATVEAVNEDIQRIASGNDSSLIPEMATASMWVTDEHGNIY